VIQFVQQKYRQFVADRKFEEIFKGSAWALGARVIATALTFITSIVVARLYGADMLGVVAVIQSFLSLTTIFTVLGTHNAILRLIPEHLAKYSATSAYKIYCTTQSLVLVLSIAVGGILYFFSESIAVKIFAKPQLSSFFALAALFILFSAITQLNTQSVRGLRMIRTFAIMQVLPSFTKLVILLLLTFFYFPPEAPVYALLAALLISALTGFFVMNAAFKERMTSTDRVQVLSIRELLALSLPMLMTSAMTFLIGQTGVIMLGMFRTEAEVGHYDIAVKLATLTSFALNAINSMAAPKFSELFHGNRMEELFYVAKKSSQLIFWVTTPILVGLLACGYPLITLVYGTEFASAYGAMIFLIIGQFVHSISGSTGYFMNMTGNHLALRNIMLGAVILTITLNAVLIRPFGIIGAAISAMISIIYWNTATLLYIKKKFGKSIGYLPFLIR
jgi:O-antigen/teichoic acid export membrane protein